MNFLSLFVLIPLLMTCAMFLTKDIRRIRAIMVVGASLLLGLSVALVAMYLGERSAGNGAEMLFTADAVWYAPLNIHYSVGVDGISVAMLLLSSVIVFTGVFASWKMSMKLTLMLMGGSALLLVGILGIYFHSAPEGGQLSMNILEISKHTIPMSAQYLFFPLTFVGFGVLGAMFPFHTWSPDGHASAPSVSHCGLVLFAILMLNQTAMTGAVLQMLSHGLMTALFFALIGMIYGRTHTRDVREMGGLMKVMPFLSVCFVIAGLASLGLPGLSGFVAEMTVFVGSFEHTDTFHRVFTIVACSSIVITAVYILRMVGKVFYGSVLNKDHLALTDAVWFERLSVVVLIVAIAGLGMAPLWVSNMINDSLLPVVQQLMK